MEADAKIAVQLVLGSYLFIGYTLLRTVVLSKIVEALLYLSCICFPLFKPV